MDDARTGRHALHIARANDAGVTHGVLMFERAGKKVGNNFHIAMRVHAEAFPRRDAILVDDAERAKMRVRGIVIIREGKSVIRIEPAVIEMAALVRWTFGEHGISFTE